MKLVILYHDKSEYSRPIEDFAEDCRKKTSKQIETLSLETREGDALASLYGPLEYPSILVIRDDGQLVKGWQGGSLPIIDEVMGFLNS